MRNSSNRNFVSYLASEKDGKMTECYVETQCILKKIEVHIFCCLGLQRGTMVFLLMLLATAKLSALSVTLIF